MTTIIDADDAVTETDAPASGAASPGAESLVGAANGAGERSVLAPRSLMILAAVVAAGRLVYSIERATIHVSPDEPANLGLARWLSGTGSWNMFSADVWRPGTAVVLAPFYWVTDDQATIVRLSLALGAIFAGWSAVWLARLTTRLTDAEPRAALFISGAVALMPASLSATAFVWAESLVTLTFLIVLWHLMLHVEAPSYRHALAAAAWASVGLIVHSRLMPLVAVAIAVVILRSALAKRWGQAASALAVGAVITLAGEWLMAVAKDRVWESTGTTNSIGGTLGRLADPVAILDAASGQLWYLLASSALLFGVGVFVLVRTAVAHSDPRRWDAVLVLAVTGVLVGTSVVFMSDRWRTDHLIYGRYNDAVLWPVVAVGAAWLVNAMARESARVRWWLPVGLAAGLASLAAALVTVHGDQFERSPVVGSMVAGIQPVLGRSLYVDPARVTLVALAVAGLLVMAMRSSRPVQVTLVISLLLLGGVAMRYTEGSRVNYSLERAVVGELSGDVIPVGSTVGVRIVPDEVRPALPARFQAANWYLYEWFLDDVSFATDTGLDDDVGPYVFSTADDPWFVAQGAELLWVDPNTPLALWREPTVD